MNGSKERPPFAPMADTNTNYNANSKQFAGVRKDLNELINLGRKILEHLVKNSGGRTQ